uniref:25S rRNA (uridine-N(3))-methyltransferase BMT5-like domain-containing protein n=1 Tax=Chromera velia CCMP2878 TaxID=1169474 RepID=A0A0G4GFW3_9ALVE|eukprot:Cvel_4653.t1-p1 / transcript=Cvel_4653.t1 / gene=Cvel_4653 / organism=Chromera_velia_CCMP2878 / gene_product=UPF0617 protein C1919.13c, putative / transcript_product=UPF0617 protein C1919.13c, putative / location=Cvel_scaffold205:74165-75184(+) / protein_length=340 / sequence_SO=supercontig / SO=protein_coding / is_pseudo=false
MISPFSRRFSPSAVVSGASSVSAVSVSECLRLSERSFASLTAPARGRRASMHRATQHFRPEGSVQFEEQNKLLPKKKSVLVVGDGDLSFAASLVHHVDSPSCLTASVYESQKQFLRLYGGAENRDAPGMLNLRRLEHFGAKVKFGIDATNLHLMREEFDCVIFNFPYPIEGPPGPNRRIHLDAFWDECALLLRLYFESASKALTYPDGEVWTSLVNKQFSMWRLEEGARSAGLEVVDVFPFRRELFRYYTSRFGDRREHVKGASSLKCKEGEYVLAERAKYYVLKRRGQSEKKRRGGSSGGQPEELRACGGGAVPGTLSSACGSSFDGGPSIGKRKKRKR